MHSTADASPPTAAWLLAQSRRVDAQRNGKQNLDVGVLVEVPVMLSVVHIVRRSRGWYEQGQVKVTG